MRVSAGRFKGRTLASPVGQGVRPTSQKVKEAVFSMLGPVQGLSALDLFAGTGSLGIEALSRGVARAVFVESDRDALACLRRNLGALELPTEQAEVRAGDALTALSEAARIGESFDLVFIDPPYAIASQLASELQERLPPVLAPGARVVVESDRRRPLPLPLQVRRERRYRDTSITILCTDER